MTTNTNYSTNSHIALVFFGNIQYISDKSCANVLRKHKAYRKMFSYNAGAIRAMKKVEEGASRFFQVVTTGSWMRPGYIRTITCRNCIYPPGCFTISRPKTRSLCLTGKVIGTFGCRLNDGSQEYPNVFDGLTGTSFDHNTPDDGWAGLDLGILQRIMAITYTPRNQDNYVEKWQRYELFVSGKSRI